MINSLLKKPGLLCCQRGITLMETLVASLLLMFVFTTVTSVYVTALKLFDSQIRSSNVDSLIALETITRVVNLGFEIQVPSSTQLKVRIDTNDPVTLDPNDDTWFKFGFLNGTLRQRTDPVPVGDVLAADPEVFGGLVVDGASFFKLINPSNEKNPTVVNIRLDTTVVEQNVTKTLITSVAAGAMSK